MSNYQLIFFPEENLTRTNIRRKLASVPKLQRAVNILSEMLQIKQFKQAWWQDYGCEPEELIKGLRDKGYDWDELLSTRGWHSFDENHPLKELSTIDMLRMLKDEYFPYWMDPVTKRAKV